MYQLRFFGQTFTSTGTIRQALQDAQLDAGANEPYVDGQAASLDTTPAAGSTVTFRPRASGKSA